ncbi:28S ribosomal protein S31, mitochondrial [Teleopsis dalmanni]|uniref:28S ribosomal protein S31, mitochondrial n=1 Tax=Teleopsis dalmanni TaxID=139649 RepID=UPI0018CE9DD9|nr:28S ribosomal protein S31, mitochondrial [Teleopsis dalmanni]
MLLIRRTPEITVRSLAAQTNFNVRKFSKDSEGSENEKDADKSKPEETETAASRLNKLLSSMQKTDTTYSLVKQVTIPRPGEAHKKRKDTAKQALEEKDIVVAAKRVAELLGGENKKQTESELLAKLLGSPKDESGSTSEQNLSNIIVGMKIDRSKKPDELTRAEFVRRVLDSKTSEPKQTRQKQRKREAATYTGSVNLYGGKPLGIFQNTSQLRESPDVLNTWSHLYHNDLKLQVTHPPANYFEKIALWTKHGKVWRFPIDNEQDWTDEIDVDFSEHIFLDQHLEGWCPTKGPIRHFMELVCVGLSKNPYITAKEKKDHILWYRDYFESKKDILKDLMSDKAMDKLSAKNKSISS